MWRDVAGLLLACMLRLGVKAGARNRRLKVAASPSLLCYTTVMRHSNRPLHLYCASVVFLRASCILIARLLCCVVAALLCSPEVCGQLARRDPHLDVPIILVSAHSEEAMVVRGLDSGAVDYITKPFKRAEFLARIRAKLTLCGGPAPKQVGDSAGSYGRAVVQCVVCMALCAGKILRRAWQLRERVGHAWCHLWYLTCCYAMLAASLLCQGVGAC